MKALFVRFSTIDDGAEIKEFIKKSSLKLIFFSTTVFALFRVRKGNSVNKIWVEVSSELTRIYQLKYFSQPFLKRLQKHIYIQNNFSNLKVVLRFEKCNWRIVEGLDRYYLVTPRTPSGMIDTPLAKEKFVSGCILDVVSPMNGIQKIISYGGRISPRSLIYLEIKVKLGNKKEKILLDVSSKIRGEYVRKVTKGIFSNIKKKLLNKEIRLVYNEFYGWEVFDYLSDFLLEEGQERI